MQEHPKILLNGLCSFGPCGALPTALVVLLHGRGDTGQNLLGLASQLSQRLPGTRFLLPTAPPGPHGLNSWYETDLTGNLDGRIYELHDQLLLQIQLECQKLCIEMRQVAFLGFSQGSMLAALLALQLSKPCAGLLILCGGVPWHLDVTDTLRNTNILYIAGKRDRTVTVDTTRMAKDRLLELGTQRLQYLEIHDLVHEISLEVVELASDFLHANLSGCQVLEEGGLQIPGGMKVTIASRPPGGKTGTIESFQESEGKYWVQFEDGQRELLDSRAFTQQLNVCLGGDPAVLVGRGLGDDGCVIPIGGQGA